MVVKIWIVVFLVTIPHCLVGSNLQSAGMLWHVVWWTVINISSTLMTDIAGSSFPKSSMVKWIFCCQHHVGISREQRYNPTHSEPQHYIEVSGHVMVQPLLPLEKNNGNYWNLQTFKFHCSTPLNILGVAATSRGWMVSKPMFREPSLSSSSGN